MKPIEYRRAKGISTAQFISLMQMRFPKYCNAADTMANHCDEYGVELSAEALKWLTTNIDKIRSIKLEDIGLGRRTYNTLIRNDINTFEQLLEWDVANLSRIKGFGAKGVYEVVRAVERQGEKLAEYPIKEVTID